MQLYKIPSFADGGADKFLQHVAHARGKLRKGGVPDMPAAAKVVLQVRCSPFAPFSRLSFRHESSAAHPPPCSLPLSG